jgi:hypothetical protein
MILTGPQPEQIQPAAPERSTLSSVYLILAVVTAIGALGAIVLGAMDGRIVKIIAGCVGLLSAVILFGLAEFFDQVTRITAATEETARLLRDMKSSS